jgi:hypothetical protein
MDMVRDALIEKDRLLAIQEGLIEFLMDEVVNLEGKRCYDGHFCTSTRS